ncbi:MAG: hypothetical protein F6J89_11915, partial [Symploca sp. SIO1C4]|nr:hypothetical protein [Symploca sp. SIO1C4]
MSLTADTHPTAKQLAALNRQLQLLKNAQSNLIATVAHELWTPLSTIQVSLESLANEGEVLPRFRQLMLDIALRDAQRLYQLLQDLLTLSKLEQGQVYHRRESLELQQALDLVLEEALLRMLELHQGEPKPYLWREVQLSSVEAITTQAREALTQAQRDQDIAVLNRQLAILEHTRSNLIAIVGHELRTPLSTIQICLESLASE